MEVKDMHVHLFLTVTVWGVFFYSMVFAPCSKCVLEKVLLILNHPFKSSFIMHKPYAHYLILLLNFWYLAASLVLVLMIRFNQISYFSFSLYRYIFLFTSNC